MADSLETKVDITILKKMEDVFAAVLDPRPFFVETASEPMREGKKIIWKFPEFEMRLEISVEKIIANKTIIFKWPRDAEAMNTVHFEFETLDSNVTTVSVVESGWTDDENGRFLCRRNTAGWMNMLCCLKAHLEYGVNLRKGAFIHMKAPPAKN